MKHCQNKTQPKFMYYFLKFLFIAKKKKLSGYWTRDGKMGFGYPKYYLEMCWIEIS